MAENEKNSAKTEKTAKVEKSTEKSAGKSPKSDKPSLFARLGTWFKSLKSECKKISWAGPKLVKQNTILVCVCVLIVGLVIGLLDYGFSQTIVGLSRIL